MHKIRKAETPLPFLDDVFLNSPLCQICEYGSTFGGVCSLLLNRRIPFNLVVKNSQIITCSAHRNWIENFGDDDDASEEKDTEYDSRFYSYNFQDTTFDSRAAES